MIVREFLTKWGFKVEGQNQLKGLENRLSAIQNRLNLMIAGKVAAGLFHMAERFSKVGEQIEIASNAAGIGVEEFQKLAYAGVQSNVSMEELQGGMSKLARSLYMARQGSEQFAKAFADLGINQAQVKTFKNTQEALYAIGDRLNKIQDPIKRAALGQQILGRGSSNLIAMLAKGSNEMKRFGKEAKELGIILSGGQVKALDSLENSLQRLWAFLKGIAMRMSADIAPVFEKMVNEVLEFYKANRKVIESQVTTFLETFAFALGFVWEAIKAATQAWIDFSKSVTGKKTWDGLVLSAGIAGTVFQNLLAILKMVWTVIEKIGSAIGFVVGKVWDLSKGIASIVKPLTDLLPGIPSAMEMYKGLSGGNGATGTLDKMSSTPGPVSGGSGGNYSINAPISITVPDGTNPNEVGKSVREGVFDHLERVLRETDRSFTRVRAY